ncbi:hypothetical protein HD554DRAFT_2042944 [Boletus coccyginus]|nr:hypothetical protein HD554DRAFT_2042944 [Boletus coccyginus]
MDVTVSGIQKMSGVSDAFGRLKVVVAVEAGSGVWIESDDRSATLCLSQLMCRWQFDEIPVSRHHEHRSEDACYASEALEKLFKLVLRHTIRLFPVPLGRTPSRTPFHLSPVVNTGYALAVYAGIDITTVSGQLAGPVTFFGGIPFAQQSLGHLRFRVPRPWKLSNATGSDDLPVVIFVCASLQTSYRRWALLWSLLFSTAWVLPGFVAGFALRVDGDENADLPD